tara:strand:- start:351 stop:1808 length:1458 start_codon:yes stop_codon:yes gene_type:complete
MKSKVTFFILSIYGGALAFLIFSLFGEDPVIIDSNEVKSEIVEPTPFSMVNSNSSIPKELDFTSAAEKTVNAVVHISSEYQQTYQSDPMFEFFWGPQGPNGSIPQIATGSGVIISEDGYIITNNHVIDDAEKIMITFNEGRELEASLVGADPNTDLALLKVDETNLPYTSFGNSDEVKLGDWVLAVGNPFNLTSTVTAGIVSAKARNINILRRNENVFPLESFIQTDAAVNPGNSGGALVNPQGLLVGINTAIASKTGSYSGYSFAIPSNIALKVVNDLKKYGMVQRAFIGVIIQDVSQEIMNDFKLPDTKGVMVKDLTDGGAAVDAGIKVNDVILKVENIEVNDVPELQEQIGKFKPGDEVSLIVRRNNDTKLVRVVLRNENGNTTLTDRKEIEKQAVIFGASFRDISDEYNSININHGVIVEDLKEGRLKDAGLKKGFIITHIDKYPIKSKKQLLNILKSKKGGILIEGKFENGVKGYFGFGL